MSQSLYSLLQVNDPIVLELPNDHTDTYIRAIREQVKPSLQIVVVIFPSQRDDRYSSIKVPVLCLTNAWATSSFVVDTQHRVSTPSSHHFVP